MTSLSDWVAALGGIVAGVGGIASVVLAVKSMRLSREAQKKIDEIVDDDRRYHQFTERHIARGLKTIKENPGGTKRYVEIDEPENERYLARAVREGLFEPADYGRSAFWVTK